MKRLFCLSLTILLVFAICSCESSDSPEYDPSRGNVAITDKMAEEIFLEVFLDTRDNPLFSGDYIMYKTYEDDVLSAANSRASDSGFVQYRDIKEFTSVEITSEDYIDTWHYAFYGKIYGKDIYNNNVAYNFYMSFYCREDTTNPSGYTIKMGGINIDI